MRGALGRRRPERRGTPKRPQDGPQALPHLAGRRRGEAAGPGLELGTFVGFSSIASPLPARPPSRPLSPIPSPSPGAPIPQALDAPEPALQPALFPGRPGWSGLAWWGDCTAPDGHSGGGGASPTPKICRGALPPVWAGCLVEGHACSESLAPRGDFWGAARSPKALLFCPWSWSWSWSWALWGTPSWEAPLFPAVTPFSLQLSLLSLIPCPVAFPTFPRPRVSLLQQVLKTFPGQRQNWGAIGSPTLPSALFLQEPRGEGVWPRASELAS